MSTAQYGFDFDVFEMSGFSRPSVEDFEASARKAARERAEKDRIDRERRAREEAEAKARQKRQPPRSHSHRSPWEILGVSMGASKREVRDAWKRLAKRHHPDTGGDPDVMKEVNAAYNRLK